MSIELKKVAEKSLLYDGTEDDFYKIYTVTLDNGDVMSFTPTDVVELERFEKTDSRNIISLILEKTPTIKRFAPVPDFIYYKNQQGVIPHIKENDKYLAVISLGEMQPARYQVYVEAIFEKTNFTEFQ
jgi:hypothetical protein